MMKVRILDRCEFCDGEVSMREARRLIAIGLAKCAMAVVVGQVFQTLAIHFSVCPPTTL
jgi:hypothetical protein